MEALQALPEAMRRGQGTAPARQLTTALRVLDPSSVATSLLQHPTATPALLSALTVACEFDRGASAALLLRGR